MTCVLQLRYNILAESQDKGVDCGDGGEGGPLQEKHGDDLNYKWCWWWLRARQTLPTSAWPASACTQRMRSILPTSACTKRMWRTLPTPAWMRSTLPTSAWPASACTQRTRNTLPTSAWPTSAWIWSTWSITTTAYETSGGSLDSGIRSGSRGAVAGQKRQWAGKQQRAGEGQRPGARERQRPGSGSRPGRLFNVVTFVITRSVF